LKGLYNKLNELYATIIDSEVVILDPINNTVVKSKITISSSQYIQENNHTTTTSGIDTNISNGVRSGINKKAAISVFIGIFILVVIAWRMLRSGQGKK
ncbi:MAG: hypothetical protein GSR85_10625, partial [Desulfurococcales archaeon]|nr:hypothetical protein [Desulfurococcales archaeon]